MPCVTDLTHVSTNSLPSTLLKKTNGRNQVPFHDRIVPSAQQKKPQQRNDTEYDDEDIGEQSSESTQSTPLSRTAATTLNREISLDVSRNRPIVAPYQFHSTNNESNNMISQRPRRPSPERKKSHQNTAVISSKSNRPSVIPPTSISRSVKTTSINYMDEFDEFLNSTSNLSSPVDLTKSVLQHPSMKSLSSSVRENKKSIVNTTKQSNHNSTILHQNATDISEVLGRTIPFSGSSVNVLCSNDEADDDDDRHRYIVSITTSRSTIKASGGRNGYPRMDDYVAAKSPVRPMKSYFLNNYSTQQEEEEREEADEAMESNKKIDTTNRSERQDVLHESTYTYDHNVGKSESFASAKHQSERENDIISAANSRRSGKQKLSTITSGRSRDNTNGIVPTETYGRNDCSFDSQKKSTRSDGSHHHQQSTESLSSRTPSNGPFTAQMPASDKGSYFTNNQLERSDSEKKNTTESIMKDEASQSKTLSSTRFIRNASHNDDDDIVEAERENEILSAAASRKTGKTGQTGVRAHTISTIRSREVMIEDHENPTKKNTAVQSTSAWRKIDDVLFGDDLSELHLFKKPSKDVAFDDLLTTTSDCSSISVSLDPSGRIVNESNVASLKRSGQVRNVITDVEFNRVKSVLDRMKKPIVVHTSTNNVGNVTLGRGGGIAAIDVPKKLKNRIGTINFVQNRFVNAQHLRAAKQIEESRKTSLGRPKSKETRIVHEHHIPVVVQATSFHGDASDQSIIESVPVVVPSIRNQRVLKSVDHQPNSWCLQSSATNGSSGRKDPPANTLCSEHR